MLGTNEAGSIAYFVANERRDLAEAAAGEKDGGRAEDEVQVLGVRDEGEKDEQR